MTKPSTRRAFLTLATLSVASAGLTGCSLFGIKKGGDPVADAPSGSAPAPAPVPAQTEPSAQGAQGARTLVAYFSVPETDSPNGMTRDEENSTHVVDGTVYGNTQYVAKLAAERLGADQFRIETAEKLPLDHQTLIDLSRTWQRADARPALKALIPNLDQYDTVIVGYPIWDYDMPAPLYSFFEQHDFAGKNVYLYATHDVSGLSGTPEKITGMLAGATVSRNTFEISRNDMDGSEARVGEWIATLGV